MASFPWINCLQCLEIQMSLFLASSQHKNEDAKASYNVTHNACYKISYRLSSLVCYYISTQCGLDYGTTDTTHKWLAVIKKGYIKKCLVNKGHFSNIPRFCV